MVKKFDCKIAKYEVTPCYKDNFFYNLLQMENVLKLI